MLRHRDNPADAAAAAVATVGNCDAPGSLSESVPLAVSDRVRVLHWHAVLLAAAATCPGRQRTALAVAPTVHRDRTQCWHTRSGQVRVRSGQVRSGILLGQSLGPVSVSGQVYYSTRPKSASTRIMRVTRQPELGLPPRHTRGLRGGSLTRRPNGPPTRPGGRIPEPRPAEPEPGPGLGGPQAHHCQWQRQEPPP